MPKYQLKQIKGYDANSIPFTALVAMTTEQVKIYERTHNLAQFGPQIVYQTEGHAAIPASTLESYIQFFEMKYVGVMPTHSGLGPDFS